MAPRDPRPVPEPEPELTPEPTPEPSPEPTPEPTSEPTSGPTPRSSEGSSHQRQDKAEPSPNPDNRTTADISLSDDEVEDVLLPLGLGDKPALAVVQDVIQAHNRIKAPTAVSYTHLTLPTTPYV